jgi:hypothetical protein
MNKNKTNGIALVAITVILVGTTFSLASTNLKATTDDEKDEPALSKEIEISNPSGEHVKEIESNKNSERATVTQEQDTTHKVDPNKDGDHVGPAKLSVRTVERGDETETTVRSSGSESSYAASEQTTKTIHVIDAGDGGNN